MSDAEIQKQAYAAMHDVIYRTAALNGSKLAAATMGTENIGFHIVTGAMVGLAMWALEAKPEDVDETAYTELLIKGMREALLANQPLLGDTAGNA